MRCSPISTTPPRLLNLGSISSAAIVSALRNWSIVTFVDCGETHDKETRRLSVIPIISSGRVLILINDRVRPGRERMSRESRYASERPVKHRPHARVAGGVEQPKKTVSGSSIFCGSKSAPKVSAYRGRKQSIRLTQPDGRSVIRTTTREVSAISRKLSTYSKTDGRGCWFPRA